MSGFRPLLRDLLRLSIAFLAFLFMRSNFTYSQQRPFTVVDDIGFAYFGDPFQDAAEPITFSPDGKYFVVQTERGRLNIHRPESTLRVYSVRRIKFDLAHAAGDVVPTPDWMFSRSEYKDGPQITHLRWLRDSRGFCFLARTSTGTNRLFLADLATKQIRPLTSQAQDITAFDVRDRDHYVYTVLSPAIKKQAEAENAAISVVGTDRKLVDLLSPATSIRWHDRSELWGSIHGKRIQIKDPGSGRPLAIHWRGQTALALSPDGHTVLTALVVPSIPSNWPVLYPPPSPASHLRISAGEQNPEALDGWFDVSRYVVVDLAKSAIKTLPLGPIGYEAGWIGLSYASWSSKGRFVALTNSFLDRAGPTSETTPAHPCALVFDLKENSAQCLEQVTGDKETGEDEEGYRLVSGIDFDPMRSETVRLTLVDGDGQNAIATYGRSRSNSWIREGTSQRESTPGSVQISIRQDVNHPPVLIATDPVAGTSRTLLDPNPWIWDIALGDVSKFIWWDNKGRELAGGLYRPPHFDSSKRYPLVIQNHGFDENQFVPSGIYPEGFAARELAAAGILVLQVRGCPIRHTPDEGTCQVEAYQSAIEKLVAQGIVDPDRIGIVGFSRTCFYVLEAITTGHIHYRAASITDGIDMGYLQYLISDKSYAPDMTSVIGVAPFGDGLSMWLTRSPDFQMDKVTTPLLIVGVGNLGMLSEWEPYSTLWHLGKPVDLILLKQGTHPLTNPDQRLISQGSTVDWMRFWLLGEEDSSSSKKEQYIRWRQLRDSHR